MAIAFPDDVALIVAADRRLTGLGAEQEIDGSCRSGDSSAGEATPCIGE